jgi:broad specificity phosphatase PhoE
VNSDKHQQKGKLIFVRHGETDANRERIFAISDDIPLNETGRRQAYESATRIAKRFCPQRVLSSYFLRARQSAEIIAKELELPLGIFDGIHERDLGCLKGEPYEKELELAEQDPEYDSSRKWLWRPLGGESFEDVRLRVGDALEALRQQYGGEEVVVVTHGGVMLSLWSHLANSWEGAEAPANCGLILVSYDADRFLSPELVED